MAAGARAAKRQPPRFGWAKPCSTQTARASGRASASVMPKMRRSTPSSTAWLSRTSKTKKARSSSRRLISAPA